MPFDNVYREKKMPSPLRYTWRIFYGDALAMIGFYGVIALLLLSLFGSLLAPTRWINSSSAISCCRRPGRATATCRSFSAPTISGATSSAGC